VNNGYGYGQEETKILVTLLTLPIDQKIDDRRIYEALCSSRLLFLPSVNFSGEAANSRKRLIIGNYADQPGNLTIKVAPSATSDSSINSP
jgi:hypothetical protein